MESVPKFNAADWIVINTRGGPVLSAEASSAVASFTLMWNLFEEVACNNKASVSAFEQFISIVVSNPINPEIIAELQSCLSFWKFRYRTPEGFDDRFLGLYFRKGDKQALVEAVLEERVSDLSQEILALVIIIYRLRNNLFHGLKSIGMLNDQIHNLNNASNCMGWLLKISPHHLVINLR